MFSVNGVNVDEGEDFDRPGWTAGSLPTYQHEYLLLPLFKRGQEALHKR